MSRDESESMKRSLAERTRSLPLDDPSSKETSRSATTATTAATTPPELIEAVRTALLGGETHYTARPGVPELRAEIGARLARSAEDVVITSGLSEALFVSLLACGVEVPLHELRAVLSPAVSKHSAAFQLLAIPVNDEGSVRDPKISLRHFDDPVKGEISSLFDLVVVDDEIAGNREADFLANVKEQSIVLGTCDALPGMASFRVGFASTPPSLSKHLRRWKQAFSICTAAPSQRAALWAFSQEPSEAASDPEPT